MPALPSASSRWLLVAVPLFLSPVVALAGHPGVTLTFQESDFIFSYARGTPPDTVPLYPGDQLDPADSLRIKLLAQAAGKYGYNRITSTDPDGVNPQIDLLNASFFTLSGFFPQGTIDVTFKRPGDAERFTIGLGFLTEDYIAARPIGMAGLEDFSFQYDPTHPEELDIGLDVNIPGTAQVLHFKSTPAVVAGPALMYFLADPDTLFKEVVAGLSRSDPAPAQLPGSSRDPNRFKARFEPQAFEVGRHTFTMEIEDIVFASPSIDPATGKPISFFPGNPNNPIDSEPIVVRITLNR
jgi:hypothetical protein